MKSDYLKTYNVKHGLDLTELLEKCLEMTKYAHKNRCVSTAEVKHFGIRSQISNALIRKYCKQKNLKSIHNIVIPINGIRFFKWDGLHIKIPCLKAEISFIHNLYPDVIRPVYMEFDKEYVHICCEVKHVDEYTPETRLGVDRNTTGHVVVASCPETGKTYKFGKNCLFIHKKYSSLRRKAQKTGMKKRRHKFRNVKKLKHRESNIIMNINHHISKEIVKIAKEDKSIIVLEELSGVREKNKITKNFRYSLNSWSFGQMEYFIGYKAHLQGVPVAFINPEYTSQECSRCGGVGKRIGKYFRCDCGHHDHADVNAGFNIAHRFYIDRDMQKGHSGFPKGATT